MMHEMLSGPLVLPEDVQFVPVADLPEAMRGRFGGYTAEVALSRPRARTPTKIVSRDAAALVERFRAPSTIVDALIAFSREHDLDPEEALDDALPLLLDLIAGGILVVDGTGDTRPIESDQPAGDTIAGFRVLRRVQVLEDTEVFQAEGPDGAVVALKVARRGREDVLRPRLERERQILNRLDGTSAPRVIAAAAVDGRPCLVLSWHEGVNADVACAELRGPDTRAELLRILVEIARAYAVLHERGVVHGDVHPANLLVDGEGRVTVIDFGLAECGGLESLPRSLGGIPFFYSPEKVEAARDRRAPGPADTLSEQFSVAALLYRLATGDHWCDFSLDYETMHRQVLEAPVRPFAEIGFGDWPEVEKVLARALAKMPGERFRSMADVAEALNGCMPATATKTGTVRRTATGSPAIVKELLRTIAAEAGLYRHGLPHGPLCSVNVGAAGIAYAAYRLACVRDDGELLALADLWIRKALRDAPLEDAFANAEMDMRPETVGTISPYHTLSGVHLVQALIARAVGDGPGTAAAIGRFIDLSGQRSELRDLTLGRCGTVVGCALLIEGAEGSASPEMSALRQLGTDRLAEVWAEVEGFGPVADCPEWPNMGLAHGWSGLLYTTLRWHQTTGEPLPPGTMARLDELLTGLRPEGRGVWFPWRDRAGPTEARMPGWCNGSAGLVHTACMASEVMGEPCHLDAAEKAAWQAYDGGGQIADLCCGLAGRALALLEFHRCSGEDVWLRRARTLIDRAEELAPQQVDKERPWHSLYKGALGVGLALAEFERPEFACMPLLGREGWGRT